MVAVFALTFKTGGNKEVVEDYKGSNLVVTLHCSIVVKIMNFIYTVMNKIV